MWNSFDKISKTIKLSIKAIQYWYKDRQIDKSHKNTCIYENQKHTNGKRMVSLIICNGPWQSWLSELSPGLRTTGLPVQFPVRAHALVVGHSPAEGTSAVGGNHTVMFPSLSPYLSLSKNK